MESIEEQEQIRSKTKQKKMQENIEQLDDLSNLNDMGSVQNLNDRDGMDGLEWYFSMNKQRVKVKENYFWEFNPKST